MKILIALTLAVALTALVLATWPVVADAPWEDEVAVVESNDVLRCQAALSLRETLVKEGEYDLYVNPGGVQDYGVRWRAVGLEMNRYC